MNFLNGKIGETGQFHFADPQGVTLPLDPGYASHAGRDVVFGIRAEHLSIVDASAPDAFPAEVVVIEPTGSETIITCRIGSQLVTGAFRERPEIGIGERIHLRPTMNKVHLFNTTSGRRLEIPA